MSSEWITQGVSEATLEDWYNALTSDQRSQYLRDLRTFFRVGLPWKDLNDAERGVVFTVWKASQ